METIKLTKKELMNYRLVNNYVLVKPIIDTSKINIKNTNITIDIDVDYEEMHHGRRVVEVIRVPDKLVFSKNPIIKESMYWLTDMELKKGDIAWLHPLSVVGNDKTDLIKIYVEDELYYLIKYNDFIVAKRKNKIICLNGYVLVQPVFKNEQAKYNYITIPDYLKDKAGVGIWKVKYFGKPNRDYKIKGKSDFEGLIKKDIEVVINKKRKPYLLEYSEHRMFNNDEDYYIIQRADIVFLYA